MMSYYDRNGAPISFEQYLEIASDFANRRVAYSKIGDGIEVSTVWLGLDHNFAREGPPLIFETMVFIERDEPIEVFGFTLHREGTETFRWATEAQAIAGHDQIERELQGAIGHDVPVSHDEDRP